MCPDDLDRSIAAAVQRLEADVPPHVQAGLHRRIAGLKIASPSWGFRQVLAALAAAGLLAALALIPILQPRPAPEKKISQIRTEFNIPEKNIRIIWVQRDDFRLAGAGE